MRPQFDEQCPPTGCDEPNLVSEPIDGSTVIGDDEHADEGGPCPAFFTIDAPGEGLLIIWRSHNFLIAGRFDRTQNLKSWPFGVAKFRIPPGPWVSLDGKAVIYSAIIEVHCFGRLGPNGGFEGLLYGEFLEGEATEYTPPQDEESGGGTWKGVFSAGGAEGWWRDGQGGGSPLAIQAILDYLAWGVCEEDWEIELNGTEVCGGTVPIV